MKDYNELSKRYIKVNKGESIFSVIGIALFTVLLYGFIFSFITMYVYGYDQIKKETDYHIVLYTDDENLIYKIIERSDVKSAYVGEQYNEDTKMVQDAVFVNISNPFSIDRTFEKMKTEYGIDGEINNVIASYFLQGEYYYDGIATCGSVLLLAVIFSAFGIGLIRNSLELYLVEYIRDFGMLRCVGATKKEVRDILKSIGVKLETIGIIVGFLIALPICVIIKSIFFTESYIFIYILPLLYIVVCFSFDMFFMVRDLSKRVNKVSPIMAVHGNFDVSKKKIKKHGAGLLGIIFGIEGSYVHKNIMARPVRFVVNNIVIIIGVAAITTIGSFVHLVNGIRNEFKNMSGDYLLQYVSPIRMYQKNMYQEELPEPEFLEELAQKDFVREVKNVYASDVPVTSIPIVEDKINTSWHTSADFDVEKLVERRYMMGNIMLYGYSDDEIAHLDDNLIDGSLELEDDEIIVVNRQIGYDWDNATAEYSYEMLDVSYYNVGESIEILDCGKYVERINDVYAELEKQFGISFVSETEDSEIRDAYNQKKIEKMNQIYDEMIKNHEYKTYKIKAVVNDDEVKSYNFQPSLWATFILPRDEYFNITDLDENDVSGYKYKINEKMFLKDKSSLNKYSYGIENGKEYLGNTIYQVQISTYVYSNIAIKIFMVIFGFVYMLFFSNVINNTITNMKMRRKEFAQLRVIGISKKRLIYMVLLEAGLITVISNFVGSILGSILSKKLFYLISIVYIVKYEFSLVLALLCFAVTFLILGGSSAIILNLMNVNMADDLKGGGE